MYTVLQIEDEESIQELTTLALGLSDELSIVQADNGLDGLRLAHEIKPDLILLDFMLPSLSGEDVIKQIRASAEIDRTPIIFMTARTNPADIELMRALGADDVITKPFDPVGLPDRIFSVIAATNSLPECA